MARYRVHLVNTASHTAEVEAETEEEAIDLAFDKAPYENIHNDFELSDWALASDYTRGAVDVEVV